MFSILNRALSRARTSFGNKFCLRKRSRLIKTLNSRFHVKFMQLEIGLLQDYWIAFHRQVYREIELIAVTLMTSSKTHAPELEVIAKFDKAPF